MNNSKIEQFFGIKSKRKTWKSELEKWGDEVSGPAHVDDSSGVDALAGAKGVK
jgi:hypothetical protein